MGQGIRIGGVQNKLTIPYLSGEKSTGTYESGTTIDCGISIDTKNFNTLKIGTTNGRLIITGDGTPIVDRSTLITSSENYTLDISNYDNIALTCTVEMSYYSSGAYVTNIIFS